MKLEAGYHSNAKVLEAGNAGAGLYARALSYCCDHETDGFIPASWARTAAPKRVRDELERVQLWNAVTAGHLETVDTGRDIGAIDVTMPTGGYFIPDYLLSNLSSQEISTRRQGSTERVQRWRERNPQASQNRTPVTPSHTRNTGVRNAPIDVDVEVRQDLEGDKQSICPVTSCRLPFATAPRVIEHLGNVHGIYGDEAEQLMAGT